MNSPESNAIIGHLRGRRGAARPESPPAAAPTKPQKGIASVETAMQLVRIIEQADRPLALKEIATLANQGTAAVHHYLVSLIRTGLVSQHPVSGHYELGQYALQLGLAALARMDLTETATAALTRLRNETGESCFFSVWGSHGATIVKYLEGTRAVTVEVRLGLVLPLKASATGTVFLAWLSDATLAPVLERERHAKDHAPHADVEKIRQKVQKDGMGVTQGGMLPRISALSCPVFGHDAKLAGTLTVLGWSDEIDVSRDGTLARALLEIAADMSARLGHGGARRDGGNH